MAEDILYIDETLNNGQELPIEDYNLLGETAGLADDRVLQELFRLAGNSGPPTSKGVLPSSTTGEYISSYGIVTPAQGAVNVWPFRGFIGPLASGATALEEWRGSRSALCVGTITPPYTRVAFANGHVSWTRWDLVYAKITIDQEQTVTRYRKDITTKAVTAAARAYKKTCPIVLGVVTGTAAASPTKPALPADGGLDYYIPLAYVRIVAGFIFTTAVTVNDIWEVAPVLQLSPATGAQSLAPASACFDPTLPALATRTPFLSSGARPSCYLPPTLSGGVSRLIAFDPAAMQNGDIIDDSIDWRKRFFKWTAQAIGANFAWESSGATTPRCEYATQSLPRACVGMPAGDAAASWEKNGGYGGYIRATVNTSTFVMYPIDVPNGATITNVTVYVKGKTGHSWPIEHPVIVGLGYRLLTDGTEHDLASDGDPSGGATAYQTYHPISVAQNHVVDNSTKVYNVTVANEWGTNALNNLEVHGAIVTYTMPAQAPEVSGLGNSFATVPAAGTVLLAALVGGISSGVFSQLSTLVATSQVGLYVDPSTGALKIFVANSPTQKVFFWIDASGQFANA